MKQFQMLRYLKKWRYLIAACMVLGGIGFYLYATDNQTYTAQVSIRYTNSGASEGLAPDGSRLDVSDIFSSRVINGVLTDLGLNSNIEGIRSSCSVTEVIPEDELIRKEAILDLGEEYEYYPTDYIIRYTAGSSSSKEFTRRVVNSILNNYFRSYGDEYISESVLPNNAANLIGTDYDYIEQIDLISQTLNDAMTFLYARMTNFSGYRSAKTGYSFQDLHSIYQYIYDNTLPYLYSQVIEGAITRSAAVTTSRYSQSIAAYARSLAINDEQRAYIDRLIDEYAAKLRENFTVQGADSETSYQSKTVLQNVYDWNREIVADRTITYDELILRRIQYQLETKGLGVSRRHDEDMLNVFLDAPDSASERLDGEIASLIDELSGIYDTLSVMYGEFNDYRVAQNISVTSNIVVYEGLNVKLYLALTVIVFLVFGCVGAIVLGRGEDIMEYVVYNDAKTGLPNRARCDAEIAKYDGAILPDSFTCAIVTLDNLRSTNDQGGYAMGNTMLRQTALLLREVAGRLGFIGYNGAGQYMCLFSDCTLERGESMRSRLLEMVAQYNAGGNDTKLSVSVAVVCTTDAKTYNMKRLLQAAFQKLRDQDAKA